MPMRFIFDSIDVCAHIPNLDECAQEHDEHRICDVSHVSCN